MSRLRLTKIATPTAPSANTLEFYYSLTMSPAAPALIDESGNVVRLGGFTTKDYRLGSIQHITAASGTYTPTAQETFSVAINGYDLTSEHG